MRQYITGERKVTELYMLRALDRSSSFLIVEGLTDQRLYQKFIDSTKCKVVTAENKENVIDTIVILNEKKFEGVLGIIDTDFSKLDQDKMKTPNLLTTDTHDIETMIIKSRALDNVMAEFADFNKLDQLTAVNNKDLREILTDSGAKIGYFRWAALKFNKRFRFDDLRFESFTCSKTLEVNMQELIKQVINASPKESKVRVEEVEQLIETLIREDHDPWQVCCGHDLVHLLLIGLTRIFGAYNAYKLSSGELEGDLRLAYEYTYFNQTSLYLQIKKWEAAKSYLILTSSVIEQDQQQVKTS